MELFIYLFIFLFGLIIGSFLNVVIFRLESGEQMVNGRSHCRHCNHILAWYDLIPIFSFLALAGKCRYCRKALSVQYPLVEIATALLFVLIFVFWNSGINRSFSFGIWDLIRISYLFFITSVLIAIFVYDLRHYIIPDKIVYLAIAVSFVFIVLSFILGAEITSSGFGSLVSGVFGVLGFGNLDLFRISDFEFRIFSPLFAAIAASGFFFAIVVITKGAGMGGGDVKLAFLMGLVLGWPKILLALFLAFTIGATCGIILMLFKKKNFKSEIPFGPFLVLGTFVAIFWGEEIVKWYGRFLF